MIQGLSADRLRRMREVLQMDRLTLERWRQWWLDNFVRSSFWKAAHARFLPPLFEQTLLLSLGLTFGVERRDRLLDLLGFLAPLPPPATWKELVM